MKRREFLTFLGSAAAFPIGAEAQQQKLPVIGFLHALSSSNIKRYLPNVSEGLREAGYAEGRDFTFEARSAEGQYDRLPGLIAELIGLNAAVIIAAGGSEPAKLAKAATSTIPIVFVSGADPLKAGLIESLNRPGGNVTGVSLIGSALEAKRLELLASLVPGGGLIGVLVNPKYPDAELQARELTDAANMIKRSIDVQRASTSEEVEAAFVNFAAKHTAALLVAQDAFFNSRREMLVTLAARQKLPAIYNQSEYPHVGGLISYGTHFADGYMQSGAYAGKILAGAKPAELPVQQPTRFELVVNAKTAAALGLEIPARLLATADEVIE
jgi:putative ABC transport system substrate-binding protein